MADINPKTDALRASYAKVGSHRASLILARSRVATVEAAGTANKAAETLKELECLLHYGIPPPNY